MEVVLQILVLTRLSPGELDYKSYFPKAEPWRPFKDWFYYLLYQDLFWEAQRILHSLLHELPRRECMTMLQDYIAKAVVTKSSQEPVKIAVSSIIQRFMYVFKSTHSNPLAAVQWNDAFTWALFGISLAKTDQVSASLFSRICLRRSLEKELELSTLLPLDNESDNDGMDELLHEAAKNGDIAMMQAIVAGPSRYTLDDLNRRAFSSASLVYSQNLLPFLRPELVDARDGFQRTPLHWASLFGQGNAVETLLGQGQADAGLLDWFGCTLHYAVRDCHPGWNTERLQIVKALLMSDSTSVNTKDPSGLTPLCIAILNRSYDVAQLLLQHNAMVETSDYGALLLRRHYDFDSLLRWHGLLSKHDHRKDASMDTLKSAIEPFFALDLEDRRNDEANLIYPGIIELDSTAALMLRNLPTPIPNRALSTLLAFLKSEYSGSAFPAFQWTQSYVSVTAAPQRASKYSYIPHEGDVPDWNGLFRPDRQEADSSSNLNAVN